MSRDKDYLTCHRRWLCIGAHTTVETSEKSNPGYQKGIGLTWRRRRIGLCPHTERKKMAEEQVIETAELLALTSEIVSSHVSNNPVASNDLPDLIQLVYRKLADLSVPESEQQEELVPAVPIKKSVTDDYVICLEDGKKLKMLKRHLMTAYGLTPEEYRARWGLKPDYPMVAPNYAAKRQQLAKKIGLGRKPKAKA